MGRVLPYAEIATEGDLTIVKIPVGRHNPADKSDVALRRYAADWLRKTFTNVGVDHRFEKVQNLSWHADDGTQTLMIGIIYLTWWKRPEMTEFEQLAKLQAIRRAEARKADERPSDD